MSFHPHFPKLDVQFFLEIRNPWGKVKEFFTNKGYKIAAQKSFFWANFAMIRRLYNKDREVKQQGSGGYTTRVRRLLAGFFGIRATFRSVERCFVSRMRDFQGIGPMGRCFL